MLIQQEDEKVADGVVDKLVGDIEYAKGSQHLLGSGIARKDPAGEHVKLEFTEKCVVASAVWPGSTLMSYTGSSG